MNEYLLRRLKIKFSLFTFRKRAFDSPGRSSRGADGIEGGAAEGVPARPLAVLVRRVVDPDVDPDEEVHRAYEGYHHVDQDEVGAEGPDVSVGRHRSANIPGGGGFSVSFGLIRKF